MITVQDILDQAATQFGDTAMASVKLAAWLSFYNYIHRDIAKKTKSIILKNATIHFTASVSNYNIQSLLSDTYATMVIEIRNDKDKEVRFIPRDQLRSRLGLDYRHLPDDDGKISYWTVEQEMNQITLVPAPDASEAGKNYVVKYVKLPTKVIVATEKPEVPNELFDAIVEGIKYLAFVKDEKTFRAEAQKKVYEESIEDFLTLRREREGFSPECLIPDHVPFTQEDYPIETEDT